MQWEMKRIGNYTFKLRENALMATLTHSTLRDSVYLSTTVQYMRVHHYISEHGCYYVYTL